MSDPIDQEIRILRAIFWSERDPEGRAFVPLADAYLRKGDPQEARSLLEDGLGRHPEFSAAHLVAARVHRALGNGDAVRSSLDTVLELDAGNAAALRMRGELAEAEGRLDEAVSSFAAALQRNPGFEDLEARIERLSAGRLPDVSVSGDPFAVDPVPEEPGSPAEESGEETASPASGVEGFELDAGLPGFPFEEADVDDVSDPGPGDPVRVDASASDDVLATDDALPMDPAGFDFADFPTNWESAPGLLPEVDLGEDVEVHGADDELGLGEPGSTATDSLQGLAAPSGSDMDVFDPFGMDDAPAEEEIPPLPFLGEEDPSTLTSSLEEPEAWEDPGSEEEPDSEDSGSDEERGSRENHEAPAEPADSLPVTRTLGELYARQGLTSEAVGVFETLVLRHPDDPSLRERLEELLRADQPGDGFADVEAPNAPALEPGRSTDEDTGADDAGPELPPEPPIETGSSDEDVRIETLEVEEVVEVVETGVLDAAVGERGEEPSAHHEADLEDLAADPVDASPFADEPAHDVAPAFAEAETEASEAETDGSEAETDGSGDDTRTSPLARLAERPVATYFQDLLAWAPGAVPIDHLAPGSTAPLPASSPAPVAPPVEEEDEALPALDVALSSDATPDAAPHVGTEAHAGLEADSSLEVDASQEGDGGAEAEARSPGASGEDPERAFEGLDDFQDWLRSLDR